MSIPSNVYVLAACPPVMHQLECTHSNTGSPLRCQGGWSAWTWFLRHWLLFPGPGYTWEQRQKNECLSRDWEFRHVQIAKSYMGGCWVQSLSPSQGCASWGADRRRGPTGGRAKGIPKYCFTLLSVPLTVTNSPRTCPFFRDSTRSLLSAGDNIQYCHKHMSHSLCALITQASNDCYSNRLDRSIP